MKHIILTILISLFIIITSCEEVIDVDLNSSNPKIVIEGVVTDQAGPYVVQISKTTDYYNPAEFPTVSGAVVSISDDAGNLDLLTETEPGIYKTDSLQGTPGRTYNLSVEIDNKLYNASSRMQKAIEIDSLYTKYEQGGFRNRDKYELVCVFKDKPNIEDYCRLKVYKNDEKDDSFFLYNGRLSDGNTIEYERFRRLELEINDFVKVELFSIVKDVYEYYTTLSDVAASDPRGFVSTDVPANPISNISGDVLGYFGAYTVRTDSIIVTE